MRQFYISKNYRDKYTASSKAKIDAEYIVRRKGFSNIGLPCQSFQNTYIGRAWTVFSSFLGFLRMPKNGIFFAQIPINNLKRQIIEAKKRNNKVILLIHDIDCLRSGGLPEIESLKKADVLIAHTPQMRDWLIKREINKNVVVLQIFDYITDNNIKIPQFNKNINIAFAGNLKKSSFLYDIEPHNYTLSLFGPGVDEGKLKNNVYFRGCYPPEQLGDHLNAHFGLVWDGDSLIGCSGINGNYLKWICPHKLSMYIVHNLPVFVWSGSAMAGFVQDNGLGYAIDKIEDIDKVLSNMNCEIYEELIKNVSQVSQKLRKGYYLSKIISDQVNNELCEK